MGTKPRPVIFKKMSDEEKEWAADLVDSIGRFSLYRAQHSHKYALRFRVEEDGSDLDVMHELFGGYRSVQDLGGKKIHWLNLQQYRCYEVLNVLKPLLQDSRREAEIILEAVANIWVHRRVKGDEKAKSIAKVNGWMEELKRIQKSKPA